MTWRQHLGSFDNPINPEYEQEARLVEQARAGSERAFSALLARYQQPVFRIIFYLVGDEEEARDLTRLALKNALLHMPRVPSGFSIRPWLLRVAVLVALDSVRERSESPQALIASMQLPEPPTAPRIVDADPTMDDTMLLSMQQLAAEPETAIADAWDSLPVDIERELIRRLLAGLPEGDAELLALGVVGQVPTRDLAALAGTSQRSVRRRIARALILFQSRYQSVRTEALPPAPVQKELPAAVTNTHPLDVARRSLTQAGELVQRGIRGVRSGFGSVEAQERLQTLRESDLPAAGVVQPVMPPNTFVYEEPATTIRGEMPPTLIVNARPTHDVAPDDFEETPTVIVPNVAGTAGGDFDASPIESWTAPIPSMDVADLSNTEPNMRTASSDMPVVPPMAPDPPTALRKLPRFGPPPEEVAPPMPEMTSQPATTPATNYLEEASSAAPIEDEVIVLPSAEADVSPTPEAIEEVLIVETLDEAPVEEAIAAPEAILSGTWNEVTVALGDAFALAGDENIATEDANEVPAELSFTETAIESEVADKEPLPEAVAEEVMVTPAFEDVAPDMADAVIANGAYEEEVVDEITDDSMLDSATAEADDADVTLTQVILTEAVDNESADEAVDETINGAIISELVAEAEVPEMSASASEQEAVFVTDTMGAEEVAPLAYVAYQGDLHDIAPLPASIELPDLSTFVEATPIAIEHVPVIEHAPVLEDRAEMAPIADSLSLTGEDDLSSDDDATSDEPEAVEATSEAPEDLAETAIADAPEDLMVSEAPEGDAPVLAEVEPVALVEELAIGVVPTEDASAESPLVVDVPETSPEVVTPPTHGNTLVLQPSAKADYMARHRPAWLDTGDLSGIAGVKMNDTATERPDDEPTQPPVIPATGIASGNPLPEVTGDLAQPRDEAPAVTADLADIADIVTQTNEPPPAPTDSGAFPPTIRRSRTPTRPMPRLERDDND